MDEFKKAFLNRISIEGHKILNYGYAKGYKPLMEYLFNYMKTKGVDIKGKDIIITNGFTEGLEMIQKGDDIVILIDNIDKDRIKINICLREVCHGNTVESKRSFVKDRLMDEYYK